MTARVRESTLYHGLSSSFWIYTRYDKGGIVQRNPNLLWSYKCAVFLKVASMESKGVRVYCILDPFGRTSAVNSVDLTCLNLQILSVYVVSFFFFFSSFFFFFPSYFSVLPRRFIMLQHDNKTPKGP